METQENVSSSVVSRGRNSMIIIAIAVAVLAAGGGFFGGMQYQKSQAQNMVAGRFNGPNASGFGRRNGPNGQGGRFGGNGAPVVGQVISKDASSITIKLMDGSSKIVLLPSSAKITKTDTGTASDITNGTNVAVFGTTNADGSVTAQNVQLNPMFRMQGPNTSGAGQRQ